MVSEGGHGIGDVWGLRAGYTMKFVRGVTLRAPVAGNNARDILRNLHAGHIVPPGGTRSGD